MIKKLLLFVVLINVSPLCFSQETWNLIKDWDSIKIYTRHSNAGKFKEVRADFNIKATQDQRISVLKNISHIKDWSYGTRQTRLISTKSKDTLIYYSEISFPWPLSNRDVVLEMTFKKDTLNHLLYVRIRSIPGIIPAKNNIVRVPSSLSSWDVTELPGKLLRVQYTLSADPGGSLPVWLVNLSAGTGPIHSFTKLRDIIRNEK